MVAVDSQLTKCSEIPTELLLRCCLCFDLLHQCFCLLNSSPKSYQYMHFCYRHKLLNLSKTGSPLFLELHLLNKTLWCLVFWELFALFALIFVNLNSILTDLNKIKPDFIQSITLTRLINSTTFSISTHYPLLPPASPRTVCLSLFPPVFLSPWSEGKLRHCVITSLCWQRTLYCICCFV